MSFNTGRSPNAFAILHPSALLPKEPFQEIRGPNHLAVGDGEAQMHRARFEVFPETLDGRR